MNGMLLIDKPSGITSFDVIKKLKKKFYGKIGHSGVLDKFACGLIVIGIGKATKLLSLFEHGYKVYKTKINFGYETDTLDIFGNITRRNEIYPSFEEIEHTIKKNFIGKISQEVPLYSNIRVNGKKLYKYALANESVIPPKRIIYISDIKVLGYKDNQVELKIVCSKGSYIRSLARDIAYSLNAIASVDYLKRLYIYPFSIKKATCLEYVSEKDIIPIEKIEYITNIDI